MSKKYDYIEDSLKHACKAYETAITLQAQSLWLRVIKPYCEKYHLSFYSGNGDFFFCLGNSSRWGHLRAKAKIESDLNERLPERIKGAILITVSVPVGRDFELGLFMPNYEYKEVKYD